MSFTNSFLTAICQAVVGIDSPQFPYVYKTGTDVYADNDVAITWEIEPELARVITVQDYPVDDDISISDSVVGVQFKITGDLAFVKGAVDDIFDLFHGLQSTTLGGVRVVMAGRRSGAALGQDESGRVSRSENYYFTVHRPSPNRT